MASGLVALKDIPSLSVLYRMKRLTPSVSNNLPEPNQLLNNKVCTLKSDITKLQVDAIVNAANRSLLGGGGVDGAIHRAAGPELIKECRTLRGCETGSAKITDAYNLPCKKVIHAVGPVYDSDEESEPLLRGCYETSLKLAVQNDCRIIAFSAISTGVYGYPSTSAAYAAITETLEFLQKPEGQKLDKVIFCNFIDKDIHSYAKILPLVFPPTKDDLTHSGEYSKPDGNSNPGDQLPTSSQTRPRATSEPNISSVRSTDEPTQKFGPSTDHAEPNLKLRASSAKKRKADAMASSHTDDIQNGVQGTINTDTRAAGHRNNGRVGVGNISDLGILEAPNVVAGTQTDLSYINTSLIVAKETSTARSSEGKTTYKEHHGIEEGSAPKIAKGQDTSKTTVNYPLELSVWPSSPDPTMNLSSSEAVQTPVDATLPMRSKRRFVTPKHNFSKIGDDVAHGMWPAGNYKCQICGLIMNLRVDD